MYLSPSLGPREPGKLPSSISRVCSLGSVASQCGKEPRPRGQVAGFQPWFYHLLPGSFTFFESSFFSL